MGANPVQIEVGDFDEAIEIVEDEVAESKFTNSQACFSCSMVKATLGTSKLELTNSQGVSLLI